MSIWHKSCRRVTEQPFTHKYTRFSFKIQFILSLEMNLLGKNAVESRNRNLTVVATQLNKLNKLKVWVSFRFFNILEWQNLPDTWMHGCTQTQNVYKYEVENRLCFTTVRELDTIAKSFAKDCIASIHHEIYVIGWNEEMISHMVCSNNVRRM